MAAEALNILIMAALYQEVRLLLRARRARRLPEAALPTCEFKAGEGRGAAVISGMGEAAARKAAALALARYDPETLLAVGFGGAMDPELPPIPHKNMGPLWKDYLSGKVTFDAWRDEMRGRCEKGYELIWDCRIADPGMTLLELYDVTTDKKYLEAAKRLATSFGDQPVAFGHMAVLRQRKDRRRKRR